MQVMVVGLAELTHRLLPGMIERRYGRVINVASLAGLVPAPAGHTLYAAAKALVIKFSEALSNEVRQHDVFGMFFLIGYGCGLVQLSDVQRGRLMSAAEALNVLCASRVIEDQDGRFVVPAVV